MNTGDLDTDFAQFHENHPEVYAALVELCQRWTSRGRRRWSIKGAFEVLRWERHLRGLPDDNEEWKLNNNYHSRYARLLMHEHPEFGSLFELRVLAS